MRKAFEKAAARLREFLAQRDDLAVVVRCGPGESAAVLKIIEGLEEESTSELFWIFTDEFTSPAAYAEAVVRAFATKHELVRLSMEKEGMNPWPPMPAALKTSPMPPVRRIRELVVFARSLLPLPEGLVVAWVMFPLAIADRAAWAAMMRDVLQHEYPFPWCHHVRVILRDDAKGPATLEAMGSPPRVVGYEPELTTKHLEKSLDEAASDESLPLEERMQAVLITAHTDYAHKRYDRAMQKLQLLFQYYGGTANLPLVALVWNTMGEVHLAQGRREQAGQCFESALVPATEGKPPPFVILSNVVLNLAKLRAAEGKWAEAEAYNTELQKLATILRNPGLKITAIESLGDAQAKQGKTPAAVETWRAGAVVATKLNFPERANFVARLRAHYEKANDAAGWRSLDVELKKAEAEAAKAEAQ